MTSTAPALPGAWAGIRDRLACPVCHGRLTEAAGGLVCPGCGRRFGLEGDILDLCPEGVSGKPEFHDWTDHWSSGNQRSAAQRFFSWYRKVVFARTVAYFVDRYLPDGVLLEAGSGTAETSHRIDKRGDRRVLVAADIIVPVLRHCHPVMDLRMGADIFRLPWRDGSVDGIWNVGVMEHFVHDQIDQILTEFRRVLRPGGGLVLLWPATDSVPQRMLRMVEHVANTLRPRAPRLRFHPDEISQLRSSAEGRQVLERNGFEPVRIDPGLRSLMAFKTVCGRKPA